ncbi:hypothetical protein ACFLWR_00475 [Chloroflexota bacterium]
MNKPRDWEQIRLIGILRANKKRYLEITAMLRISNDKISEAENWIREASFEEVESVFTHSSIQQSISNALFEHKIFPDDIRVVQIDPETILEHFRVDYFQHRKKTVITSNESASALRQEHQKEMLLQVTRLINDLKPDLSSNYIRKLAYSNKIKRDTPVNYGLNLDQSPDIRTLRKYLEHHFNSSSYGWLMNDEKEGMQKWMSIGGEEVNQRIRLLKAIDRKIKKLGGISVNNPNSVSFIGPSYWFSDRIFDSALEGLYQNLDYKVELIDNRLFGVKYGAVFVSITETEEEANNYLDFHKLLMTNYEKSKTTRAIKKTRNERNEKAERITNVLSKFIVDKQIPGTCDCKFCR